VENIVKKIIIVATIIFLFFAGIISRYSELVWIYHSYLFALITILIFIFFSVRSFSINYIHRQTMNMWIYASVLALIALIPFSIYRYDSIVSTYKIVTPILLFFVIINIVENEKDFNSWIYILVGLGITIGILSYIQFYSLLIYRLPSIWGYSNTFSAFLVLETMLSFSIFQTIQNRNAKLVLYIIPVFFIFLMFLTVSRGGYIAFFIALVTAFLLTKNKKNFLKQWGLVFIGAAVLILIAAPKEIILENFFRNKALAQFATGTVKNNSLWLRIHMTALSIKIFKIKPLTGFGLGTFRYTFTIFETLPQHFRIDPHSLFFKFLSETGIIGTISYFGLISYFFLIPFKRILKEDVNLSYVMLFSGLLGLFAHMCIDVDTYPIMFIILFIGFALLMPHRFIKFRLKHKAVMGTVSIILLATTMFFLIPKTEAARLAIKGLNSKSYNTYFNKAIKLDAQCAEYRFYMSETEIKNLLSSSDYKTLNSALNNYQKAQTINKYDYRYPFEAGRIMIFLNQKTAVKQLEKAERLYPTNWRIYVWHSIACSILMNNQICANKLLEKANTLKTSTTKDNLDFMFAKSVYALKFEDKKEAVNSFKKLSFLSQLYHSMGTKDRTFSYGIFLLEQKLFEELLYNSST
jgi:O-antigen ligase